ncbi:MAG: hypothetical protein IJV07_02970 [Alphaproteobacteria bacterium]|nr:hypothetical protein [Alphaproteobacteria bacterium]
MSVSDRVFQLYQRFYAQKNILSAAPALSVDVDAMGVTEFPVDKALQEMNSVASYLMGQKDVAKLPFDRCVQIVKDSYAGQDFWQNLLYDYLELKLDVEEAELKKEGEEIQDQISISLLELTDRERRVEQIVNHFAAKIAEEKFHVDGQSLIRNYLKMMRQDAKKAWEVLTTNPAYFSPIVAHDDSDKVVLSPAQATEENARLAHFLKEVRG